MDLQVAPGEMEAVVRVIICVFVYLYLHVLHLRIPQTLGGPVIGVAPCEMEEVVGENVCVFVFVYLRVCVFVYLCICVFVYLYLTLMGWAIGGLDQVRWRRWWERGRVVPCH